MAKLYSPWHTTGARQIGADDAVFAKGTLLAIKAGFANVAVAGDTVVGIANSAQTLASDNESVKQEYVEFHAVGDNTILEIEVEGGTIAQANVGADFDLNANGNIDGGTAGSGDQLRLKDVITTTRGLFVRAK